jgi:hypothetical protein
LIITEDLQDPCAPYTTLSYVWGPNTSHITLHTNIETYKSGIDAKLIPQTIRDAIKVTNGLGVHYLWVDAFCIVQDSEEDKNNELVKMSDIYRNAYVTIIASSAPEGRAGFLQDRILPPHARLPFYCRDGRLGTVCVGKRSETVSAMVVGKEPVDRRAWCLQEWLLSPRKLLYTTDTLRYHCHTTTRPVENALRALRSVQSFTLDHAFLPLGRAVSGHPELAELSTEERFARQCVLWAGVVADYTQRGLSVRTDKLVAFAGVAEQFARTWALEASLGQYVAGSWTAFLPRDLLWRRERRTREWADDALRPRPREYIAPSWAWPSVEGHVVVRTGAPYPAGERIRDVCDMLECDVRLFDERLPYGRVTAGSLKVSAVVAPGFVVIDPPIDRDTTPEFEDDHYYRLFMPSDALLGWTTCERTSVPVGEIQFEGSNTTTPVAVPVQIASRARLLAIARGKLVEDSSLVARVGHAEIYFDTPERVAVEDAALLLVNRGDPWCRVTAEGLLVARTGENAQFRRLGCWSLTVELSDVVTLDSMPWLEADAEKTIVELI